MSDSESNGLPFATSSACSGGKDSPPATADVQARRISADDMEAIESAHRVAKLNAENAKCVANREYYRGVQDGLLMLLLLKGGVIKVAEKPNITAEPKDGSTFLA